jgi:hypothetical protein
VPRQPEQARIRRVYLVHRLLNPLGFVAFKMGRRVSAAVFALDAEQDILVLSKRRQIGEFTGRQMFLAAWTKMSGHFRAMSMPQYYPLEV